MSHYGPMLRAETDYDGEVFTDDLSGASAGGSRFLECTFQRCDLSELRAPRARFSETSLYAVHGAGLDLAESSWADCLVQGARLERLILGLALAYVLLLSVGRWVVKRGWRRQVDTGAGRRWKVSLFGIGVSLLERWRERGELPERLFHLYW